MGMTSLLATKTQGTFYDVFASKVSEIQKFSFVQSGDTLVYDDDFLYIVNEKGLEAYTVRLLPAAIHGLNQPMRFDEQ